MNPEKYIMQYVVKKTKKMFPNWQDVNELNHAHEKMRTEQFETGDSFDYSQKTMNRIKYHHERVGVMVSFVHPDYPDIMAIGYSLCNSGPKSSDMFDRQLIQLPFTYADNIGFGKNIALGRALDWSQPGNPSDKIYTVPHSIRCQFLNFIDRSTRYYKDKKLPEWILPFIEGRSL